MDESSYRSELEALTPGELYRQARQRAVKHLDVGFFWSVLRAIPAVEAAAGDVGHASADVSSSVMRLRDLRHAGEGEIGQALKPLYVDYLVEHAPGRAR